MAEQDNTILEDHERLIPHDIRPGDKFGYWTVVSIGADVRRPTVRCACGSELQRDSYTLLKGLSQSCGCQKGQLITQAISRHGQTVKQDLTPAYRSWSAMKQRCLYPGSVKYPNYGGRGIKICERWMAFENFYDDMGERPDGKSLDRIDVNGDYGPDNCRWATAIEQGANRRDNRHITVNGETRTLSQWARHTGIAPSTIHSRLNAGWSIERAVTEPKQKSRHG